MDTISYHLLDALPCAALLLRGTAVAACNAAAKQMFPGLEPGALPEALEQLLADWPQGQETMGSCVLDGRSYQAVLSQEELGERLLALTPLAAPAAVSATEALSRQLRQYLGDLRMAIDSLAPLLKEEGSDRSRRDFSVLNQGFYRLLRMTRHMELAEELGKVQPAPAALDLVDLCAELVDEADLLAEQAGVRLHYESKLLTLPAVGCGELLRIMLLNLLSNAMKAAGRGGTVELQLTKAPRRAVITVADSGKELSNLSLLFQDEDPGPKPGAGLGLGLTLVRRIALLHGGAILAARTGAETRLTVSLPLEWMPLSGSLRSPAQSDSRGGFSTVLVELADALPAQVFDFSET